MERMTLAGMSAAIAGLCSVACVAATCIVADPEGHAANGGTPLAGETHSAAAVQAVHVDAVATDAGASLSMFVDAKATDGGESNGISVISVPPAGFFIFVN